MYQSQSSILTIIKNLVFRYFLNNLNYIRLLHAYQTYINTDTPVIFTKILYESSPATFPTDIKNKSYNPFNINTRRPFTPLSSGNSCKNLSNP